MAKGAATEQSLGKLHSKLAVIFTKVLEKYEVTFDALSKIDRDDIESDLLEALMEQSEPNPAMLSAISKFLKDNDIGMDSEEVEELNSTARSLAERRKLRKAAGMNLSLVPAVEEA